MKLLLILSLFSTGLCAEVVIYPKVRIYDEVESREFEIHNFCVVDEGQLRTKKMIYMCDKGYRYHREDAECFEENLRYVFVDRHYSSFENSRDTTQRTTEYRNQNIMLNVYHDPFPRDGKLGAFKEKREYRIPNCREI